MESFQHGPFEFVPVGRSVMHNDVALQRWSMFYGDRSLAERSLPVESSRVQITESFEQTRDNFIADLRPAAVPRKRRVREIVRLVRSTEVTGVQGAVLGEFDQRAPIPGLTAGLIDDRFETWLVNKVGQCVVMGLDEFERLSAAHTALAEAESALAVLEAPASPLALGWLIDLLPGEIFSIDVDSWRAPSSWELRHVVGEGSFTGLTGAQAAALVGVTPQNFRKYTARDGASTRQNMSFAMWHLLLHKTGVQAA